MRSDNIHSGHRQRMKQRFLNYPPEFMYDHELLEIALFSTRPLVNTNDTAHTLLDSFGSVSGVLNADVSELEFVKGIGRNSAEFIKVLSEGVRRYQVRAHSSASLKEFSDLKAYLMGYFGSSDNDVCSVLTVDSSTELVNTVNLPYADIVSGRISHRNIAEIFIMHNTYRIILAIFHSGNNCTPFSADYSIINFFAEVCASLDIDFVNSVICTRNDAFSVKGRGAFGFLR